MNLNGEDVCPPSRAFTQDLNFQRTAYPYSNCSTNPLETPEPLGARIRNSPAQEKLCQRVFKRLKGWFNRFFSYFSWNLCSSSWTFTYRSLSTSLLPILLSSCSLRIICILSGYSSYRNKNVVVYLVEDEVMRTAFAGALWGTTAAFIKV